MSETKTMWPLSKLHNWQNNPRAIKKEDFERLKNQIQELGQYKPVLVESDGNVLGGNMRLRAYQELNIDPVWVSIVEPKNDAERLKYALSDNDRAGYYVEDELAELIAKYQDEIDLTQYKVDLKEPIDLKSLLDQYQPVEEDEIPPLPEGEPISKYGEVYKLGRHRLMCGDATKIEDVEKLREGVKIDLLLTDPPYGKLKILQKGKVGMDFFITTGLKGRKIKARGYNAEYKGEGEFDLVPVLQVIQGLNIKAQVIWGYQYFADILPITTSILCWDKTGGKEEMKSVFSHIELAWSKGLKRAQAAKIFHYLWLGFFREGKRIERQHPTEKPIVLSEWILKNLEPESKNILDLFGGSGSTLIACEQTNRTCYMMELDERYCDVIRERYNNFVTGKKQANGN